jgi:hypothetical protein
MKRTPLKKVSTKRAKELREYAKLRKVFLSAHPFCMAQGCYPFAATQVHHMAGRWGKKLLNVDKFLAVCADHQRMIHNRPAWARELGYLQYE